MRVKTQTFAIAVCFAIASIQFVSCKKDAVKNGIVKSAELTQNVIDSTTSLDSGLVAWYTFDSDILDHSGYNNKIVFNSATRVAGKSGIPKTAFRFDGVDDYMMVNSSNSLNPNKRITLYAVFKPNRFYTGSCHYNTILSKQTSFESNGRYYLGYTDQLYYNFAGCNEPVQTKLENFVAGYGNGSLNAASSVDSNNHVSLNEWYTVVYTYNGAVSKLYVNGILVSTTPFSNTEFTKNTNPLFIGRDSDNGFPYYFAGIIDEIRIYKRALTNTEVQKLYSLEN